MGKKECRICHNSHNNQIYEVREMRYGLHDIFTYFECSKCGCLQIERIPHQMTRFYPANYYSFNVRPTERFKNPLYKFLRRHRDSYAVFNRGTVGKLLYAKFPDYALRGVGRANVTKRTRILDVGCGSGWTLYTLKDLGFDGLLGIDPYLEAEINYENGLTVCHLPRYSPTPVPRNSPTLGVRV